MNKSPNKSSSLSLTARLSVLYRELWFVEKEPGNTLREHGFRLLRILILAWQGQKRNQLPIQSAALTFYSMIGIGPLVAFSIMISGFLLQKDINATGEHAGMDDSVVVETITKAITFAAPQVALGEDESNTGGSKTAIAPEVLELINNFSERAKSGTVGVVGSLLLLVIGIQVLTSIEKSFNTVWGVAKGRKLPERIVTYWTFISLGAVLGTAALSLLTANAILRAMETLPFGETLAALFQFSLPLLAFLIFTLALAVFYRFIPNTDVRWKPALIGAALVTAGLNLYQMLSFLYVQRVVDTKSLYGSVGIIIVLMLGLYIFWLLVLYGGQITYAIQNADHLTNENAWQCTSPRARETISLAILILVAREFQAGKPPPSSTFLQRRLRVPFHILNSSISHLCELGLLNPIQPSDGTRLHERAYQPGKPLEFITLGGFKQACDQLGNNEGIELIAHDIPAIYEYLCEADNWNHSPKARQSLLDILQSKEDKVPTGDQARD
jgi:membrane protein